jgi:hypothetical protein
VHRVLNETLLVLRAEVACIWLHETYLPVARLLAVATADGAPFAGSCVCDVLPDLTGPLAIHAVTRGMLRDVPKVGPEPLNQARQTELVVALTSFGVTLGALHVVRAPSGPVTVHDRELAFRLALRVKSVLVTLGIV